MEKLWCLTHVVVLTMVGVLFFGGVKTIQGIRFEMDREECFSYNLHYEGDSLHLSFVVMIADIPWSYTADGVDLVIKGPSGAKIHEFYDKTSEKFEFIIQNRGLYHFCFTNRSPYYQTVDFDIHVGHFLYYDDQLAKDEHFSPLLEQISKLKDALDNIRFEQHWLVAQTNRQAKLNDYMSRRAIAKATLESLSLIAASLLQVFLLRNLFDRKLVVSKNVAVILISWFVTAFIIYLT